MTAAHRQLLVMTIDQALDQESKGAVDRAGAAAGFCDRTKSSPANRLSPRSSRLEKRL